MSRIDALNFNVMSPEEIENLAVKEVTRSEVYDADGYPVEDGVMDPHLGVIDPGMVCRTCGGKMRDCPGHFGIIRLAKPVLNVLYVKQVRDLLRKTCNNEDCHAFLVANVEQKVEEGKKLKAENDCPACGEKQDKVKLEKPYNFYVGERDIKPTEIRERFEHVPDAALDVLDIGGRPENLVTDKVLVPPVTVRPSITLESNERSEDDLTHKLVDVIRINKRLRNNMEIDAPDFIIDDLWELLQYHVATMYDNTLTGVPPARHRSGRSLKSLIERLKGKEGRFRRNLIGKRANFSARTVISPDPNIDIDEVGVPKAVAKELTIPVKVTKMNMEEAIQWVKNGSETYPGANYVKRPDGGRKKVTDETKEEILQELGEGYVVDRHLKDGDTVLFNRQPSLHRMSIMAHRVKVMPYRTFRLNLATCAPYNADFDGDEMNLHVPQTEEARAEARELLQVENHIKSPRFGGPIIGMIQDSISGLYKLTADDTVFTREEAFDLVTGAGAYHVDIPDKDEITGKELFSLLLPDTISLEEGDVVIEDGELVEGRLDDAVVGDHGGELINELILAEDNETAARFINQASRLGIEYLNRAGFSISVDDIAVSQGVREDIDAAVEEGVEEAEAFIDKYENNELEPAPGQSMEETLEAKMTARLRETLNAAEQYIKEEMPETSARIMADSGDRGNITNIAVISGLLGQETIRGERISRGYKNRSLSHFKPGERTARARGFVKSSIYGGLDPIEMFYEIMSGREGLMDQSLRTRTSGYMYRRISNAMQDLTVEQDHTVRTAQNAIVQFTPGEDGIDPTKSDKGALVREK